MRMRWIVLVALFAAACSNTKGDVLAQVDRSSTPVDATTTIATTTSSASPVDQATVDEVVTLLRDEDSNYPGLGMKAARCVAEGLIREFGDDLAIDLATVAANQDDGDIAIDITDAEAAGKIVMGCVDYKEITRTALSMDFDADAVECVMAGLTDQDFRLGAVLDWLPEPATPAQEAVMDKVVELVSSCAGDEQSAAALRDGLEEEFTGLELFGDSEVTCIGDSLYDLWMRDPSKLADATGAGDAFTEDLIDAMAKCVDIRALTERVWLSEGASAAEATCVATTANLDDLFTVFAEGARENSSSDAARAAQGRINLVAKNCAKNSGGA